MTKARTLRESPTSVSWTYQIGDAVNINTDCVESEFNPWIIEDYDVGWYSPTGYDRGKLMPCYVLQEQDGYEPETDEVDERTFFEWALDLASMGFRNGT